MVQGDVELIQVTDRFEQSGRFLQHDDPFIRAFQTKERDPTPHLCLAQQTVTLGVLCEGDGVLCGSEGLGIAFSDDIQSRQGCRECRLTTQGQPAPREWLKTRLDPGDPWLWRQDEGRDLSQTRQGTLLPLNITCPLIQRQRCLYPHLCLAVAHQVLADTAQLLLGFNSASLVAQVAYHRSRAV